MGVEKGAMKVLTVEDSRVVTNMVRISLEKQKIECETAGDGVDALRKMKAASPRYDCVLVDINMPKMDGMEMMRQVRKHLPAYSSVPFVFLTTSGDETLKKEARTLGVRAWMKKPFSPEKLIEIVQKFSHPVHQ